ncbi:MAG: type II toxin-antitoxin system PemK/MazF family toxin [bacterium]
MEISRYDVCLVNLDPTIGHEMKKTRPCLVISPNEMNDNIRTVIITPMTTKSHDYPTRIKLSFDGKTAWIVLDQIITIDKQRLVKKLGRISEDVILSVKAAIREMFVE